MSGNPPGLQAADGLIDRLTQGLKINQAKEALAAQTSSSNKYKDKNNWQ
jgi:hypothetical protein